MVGQAQADVIRSAESTSPSADAAAGPQPSPVSHGTAAALSLHTCAEIVRLADLGLGPDRIAALVQAPMRQVRAIAARERFRRHQGPTLALADWDRLPPAAQSAWRYCSLIGAYVPRLESNDG